VAVGADGTVYYAADYLLQARNGLNGQLLWQYTGGSAISPQLAISANGTIFCASSNNNVYAVHGQLGIMLWQYTANGYPDLAMVASDGALYIPSSVPYVLPAEQNPHLHVVNGSTGTQLWNTSLSFTIGYGHVVGSPGYLYGITLDNAVVALTNGLPTPSPSSSPSYTPTHTSTPSFTPAPSTGAIPVVNAAAVLGTPHVCGDTSVVPSWLYGFGPAVVTTGGGWESLTSNNNSNNNTLVVGMTGAAQVVLHQNENTSAIEAIKITCQVCLHQSAHHSIAMAVMLDYVAGYGCDALGCGNDATASIRFPY
jgi:hypothetical protein